jgi:hypothetical protein
MPADNGLAAALRAAAMRPDCPEKVRAWLLKLLGGGRDDGPGENSPPRSPPPNSPVTLGKG